jgi:hypothetical protein
MFFKLRGFVGKSAQYSLVFFIFYFILCVIKISTFASVGRFWAEEGAVFYPAIYNSEALYGLFFIFNGHIELVTNFLVLISTLFKLENAPLATTYLSLLFQSLPVIVLLKYRDQFELNNVKIFFVLLIMVGLPQSAEVFANTINLHFHFSILAALVLAVNEQKNISKLALRFMLFLSGISGVPANFLLPIFALEAYRTKDRERINQFLIISSTAALQLVLLIHNGVGGSQRNFLSDFSVIFLAPFSQTLISPFFGFRTGDQLSLIIKEARSYELGSILFVSLLAIPVAWFAKRIFDNRNRGLSILFISAVLLVVMNIFASLGDKSGLISAAAGGRYFYATNVLLIICFFGSFTFEKMLMKIIVVVIFSTSSVHIRHNFAGPNWRDALIEWNRNPDAGLQIWPAGWKMHLNN